MLAADNDAVTTPTEGAPTLQGHIFAVTNQKGGVGTTTTSISLAASLAAMGKQVLVVDIDPQANATSSLGIDKRAQLPSVYECLVEGLHPDKAIIRDNRPGLHLLPASMALAGAEVELVALSAREHRLAHSLRHVASQFDYLLVDCPPSLGLLTLSGLTAAEAVIVPVQCEYLSLRGLAHRRHRDDHVRRAHQSVSAGGGRSA